MHQHLSHIVDDLIKTTFPTLAKYIALQNELQEKERLLSDLNKRFTELDNESFEIDDGKNQDLPEESKRKIKENLRADKMRVFDLQTKTEAEIKSIKSNILEIEDKAEEERKKRDREENK